MTLALHLRTAAAVLVLCGLFMAPMVLVAATAERGGGLFGGKPLCYAAGVECGPGPTLPMLMSGL